MLESCMQLNAFAAILKSEIVLITPPASLDRIRILFDLSLIFRLQLFQSIAHITRQTRR